ncbi:MAG TPA: HXXEE domain-containing protein [Desulfitobacterium dehalogenans]|uniref:HXXEE domain-containing protein n=1 Tax=Desulfitobacterium dehalogenans TaxID=36854 RepID=A0A7C6Z689_9FIRM|nr:HXXEE domain-containing protein [Desulfitobacterium dehalogenans]
MFELLFLMSFTLHNLEEGIWLPKWSKYAGRYHQQVGNNEFRFAVMVVTLFGYILTFAFLVAANSNEVIKYLYLGFIMMMCFNSIFPHLIATIFLKRYAPGTLTGVFLNLPIGLYLIFWQYGNQLEVNKLVIGFVVIATATLTLLRPLFKLGRGLFNEY